MFQATLPDVLAVSAVLRQKFPNLTTEQNIKLAADILLALENTHKAKEAS